MICPGPNYTYDTSSFYLLINILWPPFNVVFYFSAHGQHFFNRGLFSISTFFYPSPSWRRRVMELLPTPCGPFFQATHRFDHTCNSVRNYGVGQFSDFQRGGRGWGHCLTQRGGMGRGRIKLPGNHSKI